MTLLVILAALAVPGRPPEAWPAGLREGMSPAEARKALNGPPRLVTRQVVSHRVLEYWHYGHPHSLRLTFDCLRGRAPRLVDVLPP